MKPYDYFVFQDQLKVNYLFRVGGLEPVLLAGLRLPLSFILSGSLDQLVNLLLKVLVFEQQKEDRSLTDNLQVRGGDMQSSKVVMGWGHKHSSSHAAIPYHS